MKKTRMLALLFAIVLCASCFLCGCSFNDDSVITVAGDASSDGSQIVTFFGTKSHMHELASTEKAIGTFNAAHKDINIVYEGVGGKQYYEALDRRIASNTLDDIFAIDQKHLIEMKKNGQLVDISSALDLSTFTDEVKAQCVDADGSVYFVPISIGTYNLYVNYDLLKAHNIDVPQNYSQFSAACDYFKELGITPIVSNNGASLRSLIVAKGFYPVYCEGADSKSFIDGFNASPATIVPYIENGIDLVADMIESGWIDIAEAFGTEETYDDVALFAAGDRPFMVTCGWAASHVTEKNNKLDYGAHPFPLLDDGSVLVSRANSCVAVNAASEHIQEALEFLSYFTKKDVVWAYSSSQDCYTVHKDSRSLPGKIMAPTTEFRKNNKSVIGADFSLTIQSASIIDGCTAMLLSGATAEQVKAYLSEALVSERG